MSLKPKVTSFCLLIIELTYFIRMRLLLCYLCFETEVFAATNCLGIVFLKYCWKIINALLNVKQLYEIRYP